VWLRRRRARGEDLTRTPLTYIEAKNRRNLTSNLNNFCAGSSSPSDLAERVAVDEVTGRAMKQMANKGGFSGERFPREARE
jgi:hypothetical protein